MYTRTVTAMAGTFGYELNLGALSGEEKKEIRQQTDLYRKYAPLIQNGTYYRLSNPYEDEIGAWAFVSEDRRKVLLNAVTLDVHGNMTVNYIKPKGLKEDAVYEDMSSGQRYCGAALMEAGIPLPAAVCEYEAYQIYLEEV